MNSEQVNLLNSEDVYLLNSEHGYSLNKKKIMRNTIIAVSVLLYMCFVAWRKYYRSGRQGWQP